MADNIDNRPPRVIVCNGEHCDAAGMGIEIYNALDAMLADYDFWDAPFSVRTASCLDMCDDGPNMIIFPGRRAFHHLDVEKAKRIIEAEVLSKAKSG